PVHSGSIVAQHQATRSRARLFAAPHMGPLRLDGSGAAAFLDSLLTRKVVGMASGNIRYSLVCSESGGILDDVLVYHLQEHTDGLYHLLVVNASNREKIIAWLKSHLKPGDDVKLTDVTRETAMIAVQGPRALNCVEPLVGHDVGGLGYYTGAESSICGRPGVVSRTGYTGEDG